MTEGFPFRADHVGSLLRPPALIEAHTAFMEGKLPADELVALEDTAIEEAIALQERVGLQPVTDGELRRTNWRDRFFERVDGFSDERVESSFFFTGDDGVEFRGVPIPVVADRLERRETLTADDFGFLVEHTSHVPKATLPSPSVNHFFAGDASFEASPYESRDAFFADVTAIYRQEIADLYARGCRYLQVDEVPMAVLCDPKNQQRVRDRGEDPDELIDAYIAVIADAVRDCPADMTVCVHLCRGNLGHGQGSGGYDDIAERLFHMPRVNGYFLEYDTERSGDFSPLKLLPKDKVAVLGVISSKFPELESLDLVRGKVEEAAQYADLGQLAISPQCGFASVYQTDRMTVADEERKLANMVEIADRIWS